MTWRATVLTIFPEMLPGPLAYSLAGKALKAGLWRLETVDIRDFAGDKHRSVDDAPFGGGPGMVMRPDVLDAAIAGAGGVGTADPAVAARTPARAAAGARACRGAGCAPDLRPLRGCGRACAGGARHRGGKPRRFCAVGRRARGDRADRRLCAVVAGCRRMRRGAGRGEFRRGPARISAIYSPAAVARARRAGGARVGRSWTHPGLAPGRGEALDPRAPAGFVGAPPGGARTAAECGGDRDREVE